MNHHSVLGVAKNATKKEIKQAFVKLVKLYHPDTLQNDGNCKKIEAKNTAKFRQIHEAYKVLKDLPSTE